MASLAALLEQTLAAHPLPWIYVPDRGAFEPSGHVYDADQDPLTCRPLVSGDEGFCRAIIGMAEFAARSVNPEETE